MDGYLRRLVGEGGLSRVLSCKENGKYDICTLGCGKVGRGTICVERYTIFGLEVRLMVHIACMYVAT